DMETYFDMLYEFCATAMETDGYDGYADMRFPPYQPFTKQHAEDLAPLVTKEHIQKIENKLYQALAGSVEPYRSRIKTQIDLWKVAKLEVPAIYYTLVSAYKTPEILAGQASEDDRVELIKNTRTAVENIKAAGEIVLSMPADVRGPHMFRDGGMVGSERMKYYPMALDDRIKKLEEYGQVKDIVAKDAVVKKLAGDFAFIEGPAAIGDGVLFSDIPKDRIYKWSAEKGITVFRDDIKAPNGLFFDDLGRLIVCAGGPRQLIAIDGSGKAIILADKFQDKQLNSPNDNWPDFKGGIYFTDPRYGSREDMQMTIEGVYYLSKDGRLSRVIEDLVRPNGIIGSPDGSILYIADHGDNKIWAYKINTDGSLSDKRLFFNQGSDGMTVDSRGNIYLTSQPVSSVLVINQKGEQIAQIQVPEPPANVCFGGPANKTLFITAVTGLYSVDTNVEGVKRESSSKPGLFFD
ncbi:MAG TPA: SMP-30/gluconolactonase/LRE family protein, partial [Sedimentisphaerales bacterium]|nr:SMP-30/gluconolactonase/LRE family protein [Sedimentisphaerales bacterium]